MKNLGRSNTKQLLTVHILGLSINYAFASAIQLDMNVKAKIDGAIFL